MADIVHASMKANFLSRIIITLSLALLVCTPPALRADDSQKSSSGNSSAGDRESRRAKIREMILKKFDKNHNGKLDPEEREELKKAIKERRGNGGARGLAALKDRKPGSDGASSSQ